LSVCPTCGTTVTEPTKTWSMVGKPSRQGERFTLTLGLFTCPQCEKKFMRVVEKEQERVSLKGAAKEIKGIERRLEQTLGDLKEKLEKLKSERTGLLEEIENLKRAGEKKVNTLEEEVASLREEMESLKEMLDDFE
jgi:DNA repair exonuclease SbcCD ATPase subunit